MHRRILPAALLLLSGCSTAALKVDRAALLLSDVPPPREGCGIAFQPRNLPALSQLADSAALVQTATEFARRHPLRDGAARALYSIRFAQDGRVEAVEPLDYWLPQGQEAAFHALVRRSLRSQASGPGSVRLLVQPGDSAAFRIGRSERCPPEPGTTFRLLAPVTVKLSPQPVRVWLAIDKEGRVSGHQILSSSGSEEVDRWVGEMLQSHGFTPGLIDGVAVAMEHEEVVRLQTR
jgi:hypothetical protein